MKPADKKTIALSIFMILLLGALSFLRTSSFDDIPPSSLERETKEGSFQEESPEERPEDPLVEELKSPFSGDYEEGVPKEYRHLIPEEYKGFLPENGQEMSPEDIKEIIPEEYRHLIPEEYLKTTEENEESSIDGNNNYSLVSHEVEGKISFSVPLNWTPENVERSGPLQVVAFFSSPEPSPSPVLSVFKSPFSDINEIVKAIKEDVERENMEMEVVKKESISKNVYSLESRIKEDFFLSLSRKKIIIFDEESFVVSFIFPEKEKEKNTPLAEKILSSVEIIK